MILYNTHILHAEDYKDLQKKYSKASDQNHSELLLKMARIDIESKRYETALRNAQNAYSSAEIHNQILNSAQALIIIGNVYMHQMLFNQSLDYFLRAEAKGTAYFSQKERFYLHISLAKLYIYLQDLGNADERFLSARQLANDMNIPDIRAIYFLEHARAFAPLSLDRAYKDLSEALTIFTITEESPLKGEILLERAKIAHTLFGREQALTDVEKVIRFSKKNTTGIVHLQAELLLSSFQIEAGDLEKALDTLYAIIEAARQQSNYDAEARAYTALGALFEDLRYREKAIEYFKKSIELFEKDLNHYEKTNSLLLLTRLLIENELYSEAKVTTAQAYENARNYSFQELIPYCLLYTGILQSNDNALDKALVTLADAKVKFTEKNNPTGIAATYYGLSIIYEKKGQLSKALDSIDNAIEICNTLKDKNHDIILKIVSRAGNLYSLKGNHKKAVYYFEQYAAMKNKQDMLLQQFSDRQLRFESEQNKKEIKKMEKIQRSKERSLFIHRLFIIISIIGVVWVSILYIRKLKIPQHSIDIIVDEMFLKKYKLSEREKEIIQLIALGHTNKEVSSTLFIAEGTVKQHMNTIFKKIQVRNRIELVNALKGYAPHENTSKGKTV